MKILSRIFFAAVFLIPTGVYSQMVIDKVVATVGGNIILQSEIEAQYNQYLGMGYKPGQTTRCAILEDVMYQKLLLVQAAHDSLKVTDSQVEQEIERKLAVYLRQFGSIENFEKFYGKSVEAFKVDMHDKQRDFLLSQQMQNKITGEMTVSPQEVHAYFNSIPADSVPLINSEIEIGQIVKKSVQNPELKKYAKDKLEGIRKKVLSGELDFCSAAGAYSDDPGSKNNCGLYKGIQRGQFVPEFEAVAFKLKPGEYSEVFESDYGFHFVQLVERRGDEIDVKHILVAVPSAPADLLVAKARLDSVRNKIVNDTLKFCDAAARFSDDKDTRNACGLIVNPQSGTTLFEMSLLGQVDPQILFTLNQMKPGDVSEPVIMQTKDNKQAYRIILLKKRTQPHQENIKDDFPRIQEAALAQKQQKMIRDWVNRKLVTTYVSISPDYINCAFDNDWKQAANKKIR
ncbi:MAG TPA: peptidylprolyl isomerase [Bacteroidia bacterium]|jgi:peptidyl-prolyl cis-trans isomerase SurA|nr:peptidylprolyl isomerase [Bacteroidia bacterium]